MSEVEVSLQGTLETIPLPDVLALLAATRKTGELRVTGSRGDGRVWLRDGSVVGADVPRAATPVDAVFELLRLAEGTFAFEAGAAAPAPGEPLAVEGLVTAAQSRLGEWKAIEAVVPSTSCVVMLAADLGEDSVTVSRRQWKELVAAASGGDVAGAMKRLDVGEFEACRIVKELVDAGLVLISAAAEPAAQAPAPPAVEATPQPAAPRPPAPAPAAPVASRHQPPAQAGKAPAPSPDEADELVHQLASISRDPAPSPERGPMPSSGRNSRSAPAPAPAPPAPAGAKKDAGPVPEEDAATDAEPSPRSEASTDEPINRGMLLKFLSSVRP